MSFRTGSVPFNSSFHEDFASQDNASNSLSTPASSLAVRRFELSHNGVGIQVATPQSLYSPALALRTHFYTTISTPSTTNTWEGEPATGGELLARFTDYLLGQIEQDFVDFQNAPHAKLLSLCLDKFEDGILKGNDLHPIVAAWPTSSVNKQATIRSYLKARNILERLDLSSRSSLLRIVREDQAKVYAVFGGQGSNENYFQELRDVYSTYKPLVEGLIVTASGILTRLSKENVDHYPHGFDLLQWLQSPEKQPKASYLINAPISFPLIGLIQLCHVLIVCRGLGMGPREFQKFLTGATGHSQGILIAAVVAVADSWESFERLSMEALSVLLYIGCRSHEAFPPVSVDHNVAEDADEHGEGAPTPMLSVRDIPLDMLDTAIAQVNKFLPASSQVAISLRNGPQNVVVTGPRVSLHGLNVYLRRLKVAPGVNQDRMPFDKRKPNFTNRFLPVTAPFHSQYLANAVEMVVADLQDHALSIFADDLRIPLYSTVDGKDLRLLGGMNMLPKLVQMIVLDELDWNLATQFPGATHILDFGPGATAGVGVLTNKIKQGSGIRTILAGVLGGSNADVGYKSEIFDCSLVHKPGVCWKDRYAPTLVRTTAGTTIVNTKMSRLLGLPPVMVAGMTPTTVSWEFVAATMSAGYHIELAAGGYNDAEELRSAIHKIMANVPAGRGLTVNIIYAAPRSVAWQIPLIAQLREEGIPIDGITLGAGVPSIEVANSYIKDLSLKYLGLKPSSVSSIQQVIEIARANPTTPIMLQWTGGRAGGHHSFEAFHHSMIEMYGTIRGCHNIVLVAGSGLGGAEDSYTYISGEWSTKFGYPVMPFDGVLFGSRVMVAKETKTSIEAKQAIVDTPGVDDDEWVKSYDEVTGGVITVVSEMGEPIHKIATRGVKLWAEMDKTIFSIKDKKKRVAALESKREYIIQRLNDDFAKPWFGRDPATGLAIELEEMTYSAIIERFIELTYVTAEKRWVNASYKKLLHDFILQAEARFVGSQSQPVTTLEELDDPFATCSALFQKYSEMSLQVIIYQDTQYFIALCRRRGQKPVPFIPLLDESFETWFKKDSLWQSEDMKAVVGNDVGRVCILHGPVAAKHSTIVDEPIKDILDGVHRGHIEMIIQDHYGGEIARAPRVDCFGLANHCDLTSDIMREQGKVTHFELPDDPEIEIPTLDKWLCSIGGRVNNWRRAFFTTKTIVSGNTVQENPVRRLFAPLHGIVIRVDNTISQHASVITVWETRENGEPIKVLEVKALKHNVIQLEMLDDRTLTKQPVGLVLLYAYHPEASWAPIQEIMDDRDDRIKDFYHKLWFGTSVPEGLSIKGDFSSRHEVVTSQAITKFARCIGNFDNSYRKRGDVKLQAPLDFAIVVAWKAIMKPLFGFELHADLLKLVHLSNGFRMLESARPIREGDVLDTRSRITSIINQPTGKMVSVEGTIYRGGVAIINASSAFFLRGTYTNFENTFEEFNESDYVLNVESRKDIAVLVDKRWFHLHDKSCNLLGTKLRFKLHTRVEYASKDVYSEITVKGSVFLETSDLEKKEVGIIAHTAKHVTGNTVTDYLKRHAKPFGGRILFDHPVSLLPQGPYVVQTPASNEAYAAVSGDFNPIHVSKPMMAYIQLRGTITHGMYTSAMVRSILEKWVCPSEVDLFKAFKCTFTGMVLPSDELEIQFYHIGMHNGRKIIKVEAKQKETQTSVLVGEAEIDPPKTAYVFTGQGSQQVGMGMELYARSPAARRVWDFADNFFLNTYGFKITDIVKNNPKEMTIYFGGLKGRAIRENYMALKKEVVGKDGKTHQEPIFADVTEESDFYTYRSQLGLLFATQFTQPALTLMEKAIFEDMKDRGLISDSCTYAGHSLGEYSALTCMTEILPIDNLVGLVFFRGLTIQEAVQRDELGRSNFAMCAVDPTRVSKDFNEPALQHVIRVIVSKHKWLLEVVNYNVANQQYVCAGELRAIHAMSTVCNYLKAKGVDVKTALSAKNPIARQDLERLILSHVDAAAALKTPIVLTRGAATIPLAIDVPFHSSFLTPGVSAYRQCLMRNIQQSNVNAAQLEGRYIPNLTAKPFEVTRQYIEHVFKLTGSKVLEDILADWQSYENPRKQSIPEIAQVIENKLEVVEKGYESRRTSIAVTEIRM